MRSALPTREEAGSQTGSLGPHLLHKQLGQVRLAVSQLAELLDQRVPATQKPPEGGTSTRALVTHWVMCPGDSDRCTQQPSAPKLRCSGGWYL